MLGSQRGTSEGSEMLTKFCERQNTDNGERKTKWWQKLTAWLLKNCAFSSSYLNFNLPL